MDVDGVGGKAAALLVHGVGVDVDEVAGVNGAGVGEGVGVDGGAGGSQEGAVWGEVAGAGAQVEAGDEGAGGGAVGQVDVLLDEPDDVAGELGHLVGTEGNAGAQLVLFGDGEAGVQEGAVLVVVVGVAVQAAAAGELGDLFADEALFVVAVAEAFVEGVVVAQGVELAVGAGVGAAEGKAGVGGDEGGGVGVNGEEAVVGQGEGAGGGDGDGGGGGGVADGGVGGGDALFRDVGEFLAVAEAVVGKGDAVEAGGVVGDGDVAVSNGQGLGAGVVGDMLDGLRGVGGVGDVVECLGGNVLVAAAGDAAANLCGGGGPGFIGPCVGVTTVGGADVVEGVGTGELEGAVVDQEGSVVLVFVICCFFGRMGGQANDGLVAAGQQVGVVVVEVADVNTHGAARLDEGWGAGIGVEDFLLGGFGGLTFALVVADIVGAAVHVNEGAVWVGVVVPGDEADAVVGAGAVGGVVGEAVIAGGVGDGDGL
ncbi:hypothetical protein DF23_002731 [Xylella fastidiosa]|nr:hypothetical protein [Xylella fastidiosa]